MLFKDSYRSLNKKKKKIFWNVIDIDYEGVVL